MKGKVRKVPELASVFTIGAKRPVNLFEDATWKSGNILATQAKEDFDATRFTRFMDNETYEMNSLELKYIKPNNNFVRSRVIQTNNVYQMITKNSARKNQFKKFNYFNAQAQQGGMRPSPYTTQPYSLNLF